LDRDAIAAPDKLEFIHQKYLDSCYCSFILVAVTIDLYYLKERQLRKGQLLERTKTNTGTRIDLMHPKAI
jgi:hypothetical protein